MITITLAQLKGDISQKMKGTSLNQITDFYGVVAGAANRVLGRIDPQETIRTVTMTTPFYDNIQDYALVSDFKRMIDIRPQANRIDQPGLSVYGETSPRQFLTRLDPNSYSIRWNSMIRTLRAQQLPIGNVITMDTFDGPTANGSWSVGGDASGLYTEALNYVEGNGALGFNLSGASGAGNIVNTTAAAVDLSSYIYEDSSQFFIWIPVGYSSRFTSFVLRRGSGTTAYRQQTITTKADGTAFTDGWNLLKSDWISSTTTGSPDNTKNTYRYFGTTYTVGVAIPGFLIDNWTNSLGTLNEIEYFSEYLFRTATGTWIQIPTLDTDLVNVGTLSYEILKTEVMIDVTQIIRTGAVRQAELADWRMMLNGQPPNRYVREPQYRGLYSDYMNKFPSSAIVNSTKTYDYDC